jgi:superoxide dismutase, Fe-Mn family
MFLLMSVWILIFAFLILSCLFTQSALKFHGGGHVNHSIFWTNLAPKSQGGGELPSGKLMEQINKDFGSFDSLKSQLSAQSIAIQGSGWGWSVFRNI